MKTNCCLCYKLGNKTLFEELQDYKVKSVKGYKIICLKGRLQDYKKKVEYKSLSERERES